MCALLGKAIHEMTYTVSGGTLNPTHSLSHAFHGPTNWTVLETFNPDHCSEEWSCWTFEHSGSV